MTLYITEHHGVANFYRQRAVPAIIRSYSISSASSSHTPSSLADYILVTADAPSLLSIGLTSAATLTSTNAMRIPANVAPIAIAVSSTASLVAAST